MTSQPDYKLHFTDYRGDTYIDWWCEAESDDMLFDVACGKYACDCSRARLAPDPATTGLCIDRHEKKWIGLNSVLYRGEEVPMEAWLPGHREPWPIARELNDQMRQYVPDPSAGQYTNGVVIEALVRQRPHKASYLLPMLGLLIKERFKTDATEVLHSELIWTEHLVKLFITFRAEKPVPREKHREA